MPENGHLVGRHVLSTGKREKFGSRLGFILVAAGCAVGLGNVWKFPYLCGQYGGAAFILIYLVCLAVIAFPILVCELAVGRASQKSTARSFRILEPSGKKWHLASYLCVAGTYLLMMFYTGVCGWMLYYFVKFVIGDFSAEGLTTPQIAGQFSEMLASPSTMLEATYLVIAAAFGICSFGVRKGVEKVTKVMMMGLFALIVILAVNSVMLPGANAGLEFYLVPDFDAMMEQGIGTVLFAAMSQAFFTLSIGIGAMAIFGSYLDKSRSLTGEGIMITFLDTIVALMAGFIIIPACFSFGISPDAGPALVFITMPNVFYQMPGGQVFGALFFLFLLFAALSTVVAVFENIISYATDLWNWSRPKAIIINFLTLSILSTPCVLGFNVFSSIEPLGEGTGILDLEDFLVSNNLLPIGALIFLLFCTSKRGWGWKAFIKEADAGDGLKFPSKLRIWMQWFVPFLIVIIYLKGYYDMLADRGTVYLCVWMGIALLFVGFVIYIILGRSRNHSGE